ncbi:hypothetical protein [Burkholderia lata]|uniref:hypothetical protein n=1 Tax=Burkholderia lata (strain ATCC 17760 / DSM 23089 / LMG 22485 / NCIMB 9086 / R18194 / 383) TaxID=482957 RepID=UPI00158397E9|nr:hypothetical protein [Burkholderia lata]
MKSIHLSALSLAVCALCLIGAGKYTTDSAVATNFAVLAIAGYAFVLKLCHTLCEILGKKSVAGWRGQHWYAAACFSSCLCFIASSLSQPFNKLSAGYVVFAAISGAQFVYAFSRYIQERVAPDSKQPTGSNAVKA